MSKRHLTPAEKEARSANMLALKQQLTLVELLIEALDKPHNGKCTLFGKQVFEHHLAQAKNRLAELDRVQLMYERIRELPYINCNGSSSKTSVHTNGHGGVEFVEAKEGAKKDAGQRAMSTKSFHRKYQKLFNNQKTSADDNRVNTMAQATTSKKTAATKAATKKAAPAATKKATKKSAPAEKKAAAPVKKAAGTVTAQDMRDAYDKAPKTFNIAEYAKTNDVAYGRVYGAIVKHVGGVENVGKPAPKKAEK